MVSTVRRSPQGIPRLLFLGIAFIFTWVGYEVPDDVPENFWYAIEIAGIPASYLALVLVAAIFAAMLADAPSLQLPTRLARLGLWNWTILVGVVIFLALGRGIWDGVTELYADWRNVAVTGIVAVLTARFLSTRQWRGEAILDLAIMYGLASFILLAQFAAGGGTNVFGVRTPVFYGPLLYLAAFAAIVTLDFWSSGSLHGLRKALVVAAGIGATSLVILAFRRTYWLMLALAFVAIFFRHMRDRSVARSRLYATAGSLVVVVAIAFVFIGADEVTGRLASFLPGSDSQYSATNADHLADIADAWDVASENWIEGLGIGHFYETSRIVDWKASSFEVHNALVHVWLKFGLAGLIVYLGFHLRWFKASISNGLPDPVSRRGLTAAGTFLVAEFIATMFATWPYGYFQQSVQHGLLLGALFALTAVPELPTTLARRPLAAASRGIR